MSLRISSCGIKCSVKFKKSSLKYTTCCHVRWSVVKFSSLDYMFAFLYFTFSVPHVNMCMTAFYNPLLIIPDKVEKTDVHRHR